MLGVGNFSAYHEGIVQGVRIPAEFGNVEWNCLKLWEENRYKLPNGINSLFLQ